MEHTQCALTFKDDSRQCAVRSNSSKGNTTINQHSPDARALQIRMVSPSSREQCSLADDDQVSSQASVANKATQSTDERNSNGIPSAKLQPPANAFSLADEEETLQSNKRTRSDVLSIADEAETSGHVKRARLHFSTELQPTAKAFSLADEEETLRSSKRTRSDAFSIADEAETSEHVKRARSHPNAFSIGDENETLQRVQPSGPFFSTSNSVYDFPDTAALEPVNQQQVLGESSQITLFPNINLQQDCEQPEVSPVSKPENLKPKESTELPQNAFPSIPQNIVPNEDIKEPTALSTTQNVGVPQLGNLVYNSDPVNYLPQNTVPNTDTTAPVAAAAPPLAELPPSIVLQALHQALGIKGDSANVPPTATNVLSEVFAKPVQNAKDARARRGAIMRYKRATEVAAPVFRRVENASVNAKSSLKRNVATTRRKIERSAKRLGQSTMTIRG